MTTIKLGLQPAEYEFRAEGEIFGPMLPPSADLPWLCRRQAPVGELACSCGATSVRAGWLRADSLAQQG